jgi:hypothetical protein
MTKFYMAAIFTVSFLSQFASASCGIRYDASKLSCNLAPAGAPNAVISINLPYKDEETAEATPNKNISVSLKKLGLENRILFLQQDFAKEIISLSIADKFSGKILLKSSQNFHTASNSAHSKNPEVDITFTDNSDLQINIKCEQEYEPHTICFF